MLASIATAGLNRVRRRFAKPAVDSHDPSRFAPHAPDDAEALAKLFNLDVSRDDEVDMPDGVLTPYGVFGPVEHVAGA